METILKKSNWYRRLLFTTAVVIGILMIGMPQRTAAENLQEKAQEGEAMAIINHATSTWQNFMQDPDMSGFRTHVKGGQGVLIFPRLMKGAFVLGAEGGNGVLLVRNSKTGSWSEPVFYEISSASFGLQAGMETSEAILVIQTVKGIESLLKNTIKLGTDVSAVIGLRGGGVEGVTSMSIGWILSPTPAQRGVYPGVSIEEASIGMRDDLNNAYYGSAVELSDIVAGKVKANPNSQVLHQAVVTGAGGK